MEIHKTENGGTIWILSKEETQFFREVVSDANPLPFCVTGNKIALTVKRLLTALDFFHTRVGNLQDFEQVISRLGQS